MLPQPAPTPPEPAPAVPVVLSLGMGIDSAAILTRWLLEPASRDFDLADLIVVTAMVGDELAVTGQLMDAHLLPLMRAHRVRYVQLARGGPAQADGVVVLDDSHQPAAMHLRGAWRLSDELRATGTVPQVAARRCSAKFKGWVIDTWLAGQLGGRRYRHVLGFAAEETRRAERDTTYASASRAPEYPLIDWGWDRQACQEYLHATFGVQWSRSCCGFCPFAGAQSSRPELLQRWADHPDQAAQALLLEFTARALNPASVLFGTTAALDVAAGAGQTAVLAAYAAALEDGPWALYRVRRVLEARAGDPSRKGQAWRSVRRVASGTRAQMAADLAARAQAQGEALACPDGIDRLWLRRRGPGYPAVEELLVATPAVVADKERPGFAPRWAALTDPEAALFDLPAPA